MDNKQAKQLFEKYLNGNCTPEELLLIKQAYNKQVPDDVKEISEDRYNEMKAGMWGKISQSSTYQVKHYRVWPKVAVAAVLVITVSIGLYYFLPNKKMSGSRTESAYVNDVPSGGNKAVLTLGNGAKVPLSDSKSGIVIRPSALTYNDGSSIKNVSGEIGEVAMVTTPRGGQYTIVLPDGTLVTLNAASSLKFKSSFSGLGNRSVELAGEGYFQVVKDKSHPFIVQTNGQEVEVLGTTFNINSYPDESGIKTTLLEGSVKVTGLSGAEGTIKLKPGQQAELINNAFAVTNADIESTTAWKNGDFNFNEDIKTIMRKISRWYDVEVVYQGKVSDQEFLGTVSRSKSIVEILKALELTKRVHFKVEGRRVTVMP